MTRRIPNALAAIVAVAAAGLLVLHAPESLPSHGVVALAVLIGGAILFVLRLWGAGDAKLMAAATLALGAKGLPLLLVGTVAVGGIIAVVLIALRLVLRRRRSTAEGIPYGVAIACGAFLACVGTGVLTPLSAALAAQ